MISSYIFIYLISLPVQIATPKKMGKSYPTTPHDSPLFWDLETPLFRSLGAVPFLLVLSLGLGLGGEGEKAEGEAETEAEGLRRGRGGVFNRSYIPKVPIPVRGMYLKEKTKRKKKQIRSETIFPFSPNLPSTRIPHLSPNTPKTKTPFHLPLSQQPSPQKRRLQNQNHNQTTSPQLPHSNFLLTPLPLARNVLPPHRPHLNSPPSASPSPSLPAFVFAPSSASLPASLLSALTALGSRVTGTPRRALLLLPPSPLALLLAEVLAREREREGASGRT